LITRMYRVLKKLSSQKNQWPMKKMVKWTGQSFFKERSPNDKKHEGMLNIPSHKRNAN
jgi:hypothetical protein